MSKLIQKDVVDNTTFTVIETAKGTTFLFLQRLHKVLLRLSPSFLHDSGAGRREVCVEPRLRN